MITRMLVLLLMIIFTYSFKANAFWFKLPDKNSMIQEVGEFQNSGALDPNSIDVLVWNTYKAQNPSWQSDFYSLADGKDISILQECVANDLMKETFNSHNGYGYHYAISFIYKKSKLATGTCTGSQVRPSQVYAKRTKHVEVAGFTPKALLFTEYNLKNRNDKLLVINIHALNSVPWFIFATHLKHAKEDIQKHKGPVVFAGDFNTWSFFKTWYMKKFFKKLGFDEVVFPNGEDRMKSGLTKRLIDFIYVRGMNFTNSWVWGNLEGADHKAMTATLSVK